MKNKSWEMIGKNSLKKRKTDAPELVRKETVIHRAWATLSVFQETGWQERAVGEVQILKQQRTDLVRLKMKDEDEALLLNQLVTEDWLAGLKKMGLSSWRWRAGTGRAREDFALELLTQGDCVEFKRVLENEVKRSSVFSKLKNMLYF